MGFCQCRTVTAWDLVPGATGALRWLLPESLEPRDGCSRSLSSLKMVPPGATGASRRLLSEPLELSDGCSQSHCSLGVAAPGATATLRSLLPEILEPRSCCSRSHWSLGAALPEPLGAVAPKAWDNFHRVFCQPRIPLSGGGKSLGHSALLEVRARREQFTWARLPA